MKMILSICCCLSLGIEIAKAQEGAQAAQPQPEAATQPLTACPDAGALAYQWRKAGVERVNSVLAGQMNLATGDNSYNFPEIPFQVNQFMDDNGNIICQYHCGSSEPFIRINMGAPKMEKIEKQNK